MKASLLFRIASVLLVLFALGHTFGFLHFKPPTPEGLAVRDAMNNVHFRVGGGSFRYGRLFIWSCLLVTAFLLFFALLSWPIFSIEIPEPVAVTSIGLT